MISNFKLNNVKINTVKMNKQITPAVVSRINTHKIYSTASIEAPKSNVETYNLDELVIGSSNKIADIGLNQINKVQEGFKTLFDPDLKPENENTLDSIHDQEKVLLTTLAYLDFDMSKFDPEKNTINDLRNILLDDNKAYLGNLAKGFTGIDVTSNEVIDSIIDSGLGNVEILEIKSDKSSGFYAIAFRDEEGNIGITFRGTEMSSLHEFAKDAVSDVTEYFREETAQVQQAIQFFEKYNDKDSNIYLYGHSLGGNLVEHVYDKYYNDIDKVFVINPYPISPSQINSQEEIEAFNNHDKFKCYVVGGDWVSTLRSTDKYSDNIRYIKNNGDLIDTMWSDHAMEAATYKNNGNFEVVSKEEAYKGHEHILGNAVKNVVKNFGSLTKWAISSIKRKVGK